MTLKYLKISNFKHFYNNNIFVLDTTTNTISTPFVYNNTNNALIISAKNGAGKTTILDALTFLFTNTLHNGNTLGYESLDINNTNLNLKPNITAIININNKDYTIELQDSKRYINGVVQKNNSEFEQTLNNIVFSLKAFKDYSNPLKIFKFNSTNENRALIFSNLLTKEFYNELLNEAQSDSFLADEIDLVKNILEELQIHPLQKLIDNNKLQITDLDKKITNFTSFQTKLNENISFTDEDKTLLTQLRERESEINRLKTHINSLKSALKNKTCDYCKQEILNVNFKEIGCELVEKENELTNIDFTDEEKETFVSLIKKEQTANTLSQLEKENTSDLNTLKTELENLKIKEQVLQKMLTLFINLIDTKLSKNLPFELKLFHLNKNGTYKDTFQLLHNGVDFKYLNTAQQYLIANSFINYFNKNENIFQLIDNAENLDSHSFEKFNTSNNLFKIYVKVQK